MEAGLDAPGLRDGGLPAALVERVLDALCIPRPAAGLEGLRGVYAAWSERVPFDNLLKMAHLGSGSSDPLPGDEPEEFLEAWLRWGTGGTCWAGNGALAELLRALGFRASRALATMLVAPDLPPNHGTVVVELAEGRFLVDASILFGEPLRLDAFTETSVAHPARGVRCALKMGKFHVRWRPIHQERGIDCRIDALVATAAGFREFHERTRGWSPFNYQAYVRRNVGDRVVGIGYGQRVEFGPDGSVQQRPVDAGERDSLLTGEFGIAPDVVGRVPEDRPTPPPPQSRRAGQA